jgi:hypothetical protein
VGFYSGSSKPPKEEKEGSWKEIFQIIWAVFSVLAMPLAVLVGAVLYLFFVFFLFTVSAYAGLAGLGLVVAGVVGYGIWEAKHPPELK